MRPSSMWCSSSPSMLILTFVWRNFWGWIACTLILNVFFAREHLSWCGCSCFIGIITICPSVCFVSFSPPLLVLKSPLASSASVQLHLFLQLQNLCLKPGRNTFTSWSSNKLYPNAATLREFFLRRDTEHLN